MMELNFLLEKKVSARLKKKVTFALTCFVMKTNWHFQFTFEIKNSKNSIDLLLVIDENKSHYIYIKDFNRFMFHKTKKKTKNTYSILIVKMCWQNIRKFGWELIAHNL